MNVSHQTTIYPNNYDTVIRINGRMSVARWTGESTKKSLVRTYAHWGDRSTDADIRDNKRRIPGLTVAHKFLPPSLSHTQLFTRTYAHHFSLRTCAPRNTSVPVRGRHIGVAQVCNCKAPASRWAHGDNGTEVIKTLTCSPRTSKVLVLRVRRRSVAARSNCDRGMGLF